MKLLSKIQSVLAFEKCRHPHFIGNSSIGRIAVLSTILTFLFTASLVTLLHTFSTANASIIYFNLYVLTLTLFHLSEFYITLLRNPVVVSATSFLVEHSQAYTAAFLGSLGEFCLRYYFLDRYLWGGAGGGWGRLFQGIGW